MTIKPLKIATKIILIKREINLNIQNLKLIPYNQTKMQIQHGALFLQFINVIFDMANFSHLFGGMQPSVFTAPKG